MAKYKLPKVEELFDAGVHFGHQVKRWHPAMEPYIFTVRKNIHIINLEETLKGLEKACEFLYEKASSGEQIVLVGTKRQSKEIIQSEAQRCGAKYVTDRWLGGTITNFRVIKKNIDKLVNMLKKRSEGEYQKYTKKEQLLIDREIEKLQQSVGGIVGLEKIPGVVVVIDSRREKTAIKEANIANVPVVGLVDTNSDPQNIDYPIPANDDAIKSIALLVKSMADAIEEGYSDFAAHKKKAKEQEEARMKAEQEKEQEKEQEEDETERKVIKVTSDAENLVIDEDLSETDDLEKISEKEDDEEDTKDDGKDSKNKDDKDTDEKKSKQKGNKDKKSTKK